MFIVQVIVLSVCTFSPCPWDLPCNWITFLTVYFAASDEFAHLFPLSNTHHIFWSIGSNHTPSLFHSYIKWSLPEFFLRSLSHMCFCCTSSSSLYQSKMPRRVLLNYRLSQWCDGAPFNAVTWCSTDRCSSNMWPHISFKTCDILLINNIIPTPRCVFKHRLGLLDTFCCILQENE